MGGSKQERFSIRKIVGVVFIITISYGLVNYFIINPLLGLEERIFAFVIFVLLLTLSVGVGKKVLLLWGFLPIMFMQAIAFF